MRVWPGHPYPLAPPGTGRASISHLFRKTPPRSSFACSTRRMPTQEAAADRASRNTPTRSGMPTCRTFCPASSTATACTGRIEPQRGTGSTPTRWCSIPMPSRSAATLRWADELFGYKLGDPEADLSFDERDSAPFAPLAAVIDPAFTWGDDRPPRMPWHKTVIYELHVKGFTQLQSRRAREAARHLRRAGLGGGHRAPDRPGRHGRRADAGASSSSMTAIWSRRACRTTGATTRWASSRPSPLLLHEHRRRTPCSSSR